MLYQSLIPGYDHSENQQVSTTQNSTQRQQIGEEIQSQSVKDLPRVEKISIYVNEIFKQVDFSSIERQLMNANANQQQLSNKRFLNPHSLQMMMPSPEFGFGAFEHISAGIPSDLSYNRATSFDQNSEATPTIRQ